MLHSDHFVKRSEPWNKGKLVGQKPPLKLPEIWAIRIRLQLAKHFRDLALFNLAIDSTLRSCDRVKLRVKDVTNGAVILKRILILQQKTAKPVHVEITQQTRGALSQWIKYRSLGYVGFLFPNRLNCCDQIFAHFSSF
ncbi:hypothetical protein SAMN02745866_04305 [Alteromonadaceae bacterium Bs31]|nr:hypothetical protein SAMN02745866_04305 [Alteromonadaceae bacterium Bs31]